MLFLVIICYRTTARNFSIHFVHQRKVYVPSFNVFRFCQGKKCVLTNLYTVSDLHQPSKAKEDGGKRGSEESAESFGQPVEVADNSPGNQRPSFPCQKCGRLFLYRSSMQRHRKWCEGLFDISCHLCGVRFYRGDRYNEHLATKHQAIDLSMIKAKRTFRQ